MDILILPFVMESPILNEWLNTALNGLACNFQEKEIIIVSPYSKDRIRTAIKTFKSKDIKVHALTLNVDRRKGLTFGQLAVKMFKITSSIADLNVRAKVYGQQKIFYVFSPVIGGKLELEAKLKSYIPSDTDLIRPTKKISIDKYCLEASSLMTATIIRQCQSAQLHHLIIDPMEADLSIFTDRPVTKHFVHKFKDAKVNPFIIYTFAKGLQEAQMLPKKKFDFTFGLTAFDYDRKLIVNQMLQCIKSNEDSFMNSNFYYYVINHDGSKTDTRISYTDYLRQLELSKCTLVVPAYDQNTFSVHRFVESIAQGCIPLIYKASYEAGFDDPELLEIIQTHLLVDKLEDLHLFISHVNNTHAILLNAILNTKYFKNIANVEWLDKQISEALFN